MLILIAPGSHIDRANPPTYFTLPSSGTALKTFDCRLIIPRTTKIFRHKVIFDWVSWSVWVCRLCGGIFMISIRAGGVGWPESWQDSQQRSDITSFYLLFQDSLFQHSNTKIGIVLTAIYWIFRIFCHVDSISFAVSQENSFLFQNFWQ